MVELTYHHIGIPTGNPRRDEGHIEPFRMYTAGYDSSPYGVERLRFEPDSPRPELVRTARHMAFIVDNGAPIEPLQFDRPESEVWPKRADA